MSTHTAETLIPTVSAARYAQQLVKHFAHKIDASYENGVAHMDFKFATAICTARADSLTMACSADDLMALARAKVVLDVHLRRFAFREDIPPLVWSGPETPPLPEQPPQAAAQS